MKVVKLLEKKEVIRVFGVGLWVAPLINSFLTYLALPAAVGSTGFRAYWQIVMSGTTAQHVLDVASLVIGVLLLTGSKSAWKAMLALLGGYMILQVMNLGSSLRNNPLNGLFFIANVGLFLFIADQLAFKQKTAARPQEARTPEILKSTGGTMFPRSETITSSAPQPKSTQSSSQPLSSASSFSQPTSSAPSSYSVLTEEAWPRAQERASTSSTASVMPLQKSAASPGEASEQKNTSEPRTAAKTSLRVASTSTSIPKPVAVRPFRTSSARILVNFQNHGPWAQVTSISATGIELRSEGRIPPEIESREVELNLSPELLIRARLKSRNGSLYFFEYTDLSPSRILQLNQWIQSKAA